MNMTTIHELDADSHQREFFRPDFITRRLGRFGQWQGGISLKLDLHNPIEPEVFSKLLQGRNPKGELLVQRLPMEKPRAQGWRFSLTAESSVSVLWALSPDVARKRIRYAHNQAVRAAVADFENVLNGRPWFDNVYDSQRKHTLFAKFHSGATREQVPRLETNLFLFNLVLRRGGVVESLTTEQVKAQQSRMESIYKQELNREIIRALGSRVELPKDMSEWMQNTPPLGQSKTWRFDNLRPLEGSQLFKAWQEQGRMCGCGPEKVMAMLHEARQRPKIRNSIEDYVRFIRTKSIQLRYWSHLKERGTKKDGKLAKTQEVKVNESNNQATTKEQVQKKGEVQASQQDKSMGYSY
jgi:hypothetical protein